MMRAKIEAAPSLSGHLNVKILLPWHFRCFEILQRVRHAVCPIDEFLSIQGHTTRRACSM
ncbi:L-ascorbate metabolism protein UlaG [Pseudomonas syringae pv. actinidiae]|uniref:L-ascorbate metabolism protein UlaG n=1 Tax=Pseudomonas syringae pv. actinidiae TaxID=103796 RepID=A0A2V0QI28_PSESF|nr:L-ascorbate metabolism protein UlaG [Pseudomonas syringae pv. actinidiae]